MFKLNAKLDADLMVYLLTHFGCDSREVPMLTQKHLPPPLTSTVKSSLFTYAHSSPLSLAARLRQLMQTILILVVAGLFPDKPGTLCVCTYLFVTGWGGEVGGGKGRIPVLKVGSGVGLFRN